MIRALTSEAWEEASKVNGNRVPFGSRYLAERSKWFNPCTRREREKFNSLFSATRFKVSPCPVCLDLSHSKLNFDCAVLARPQLERAGQLHPRHRRGLDRSYTSKCCRSHLRDVCSLLRLRTVSVRDAHWIRVGSRLSMMSTGSQLWDSLSGPISGAWFGFAWNRP